MADNPPGSPQEITVFLKDRPLPQARPLLPPSTLLVPEPPHQHGGIFANKAEIVQQWQPDPWVYDYLGPANGTQPYAPRQSAPSLLKVPEPPHQHGGIFANKAEIVQQWQPDPWVYDYLGPAGGQQPYGPRQLSPGPGRSVDNPPIVGTSVASQNAIIQIAQPDPWARPYLGPHEGDQPYGAHKLSPGIPGQSISSPVPNEDALANLGVILTAWQPPDPQPQQEGKLNPQLTAVEVDNPPAFAFPKISFIDDFILPPTGARLAPLVPAVVQGPFANFWLATVLAAWQPPPPQPQQQGNLNPSISAVRVDNPPFTYGGPYALRASILALTQPDPWVFDYLGAVTGLQPYGARQLSAGIPGQSVNNPPVFLRQPLPLPLDVPFPQQKGTLAPGIPGQSVDQPPVLVRQPQPTPLDVPAPQQQGKLSPGIPGQSIDQPPVLVRQPPQPQPDLPPQQQRQVYAPQVVTVTQTPFTNVWSVAVSIWQPPDPLPTLPRLLNPSLTAVRVDNPPISVRQPLPLPLDVPQPQQQGQLNPSITAVKVDNPPGLLSNFVIIINDRPLPILPRFVPQGAPEVDTPPGLGVPNIIVVDDYAVQQPRTFVTQGARVDNPPFTYGGPYATLAETIALAQPDPWVYDYLGAVSGRQPYGARQLNPSIIAVAISAQTPFSNVWIATVVSAWQLPDPLPTLPRTLNPSITAVTVNNPPFTYGGPYAVRAEIVQQTQPDPWAWSYLGAEEGLQPYGARKLNPSITAVATSTQPFSNVWVATVVAAWQPADPLPTLPRNLNPSITAVEVDNPPILVRQPLPTQPDAPPPQQSRYVPQVTAATVQTPYANAWIVAVLAAWQPADPLPTLPRNLNPSITAVEVDNPPGLLSNLVIVINDRPLPILPRFVPQGAPEVDTPPGLGVPNIIVVDDYAVQQPRTFVTQGVEVDNPPFEHPGRSAAIMATTWSTWDFPPPLPTLTQKLLQAFVPQTPFNDAWLNVVLAAWQPPDPAPQQQGKLAPGIPGQSVDQPPVLVRQPQPTQLEIPAPQQAGRFFTPGVAVTNPPFSYGGPYALISEIIALAQPDPWVYGYLGPQEGLQPYGSRKLNPSITAVEVDNPPFTHTGRTALENLIVQAWIPPDPLPTLPISQVQPGAPTPLVPVLPPAGAGKRWPWPGIPEGEEKQSPSRRKSKRPVWDQPDKAPEQPSSPSSPPAEDEDVGDGLKTILPPGTPRWDQIVPPLPVTPAAAAKAKAKRRIALLSVTEANDSLRAEFINSIAARALCKEQEDISARGALEDIETFVGSAQAYVMGTLQKPDTDSFAGIGVHLGADDDDEALALLLD